jgi:hypothetical protein
MVGLAPETLRRTNLGDLSERRAAPRCAALHFFAR